jgi:hypothetical protein
MPVPSTISVQVAPESAYTPLNASSVCVHEPFKLIDGGVVSTIVTVRVADPLFHEVSVFEYTSVYTAGTFIFTEPEVARGIEPIPITVSL